MIAIFDIQHRGKPGRRAGEMGAGFDFDGDGVIEIHEQEAYLTPIYAGAASERLALAGEKVVFLEYGTYAERHAKAIQIARSTSEPVAYIACHLNAGGGDYGIILHDDRSVNGHRLSKHLAAALRAGFPVPRVTTKGTAIAGTWKRAHTTIAGIYDGPENLTGVCYEPAFIDKHAHLLTPEGLAAIGKALAEGVLAWSNG